MTTPYALAYRMVDDIECSQCDRTPPRGEPQLQSSQQDGVLFESEHHCDCGVTYTIEIREDEKGYFAKIRREDTGNVRRIKSVDSHLHKQSHPAREQLQALNDFEDALTILRVNRARLEQFRDAQPNYDDDIPLWNDPRYAAEIMTEVHNYLSAAYTFQNAFETALQGLPSGEPIDDQFQAFKEDARVVIGLRTYVQHEKMFPVTISPDMDADGYRIDLLVDLDEVWTIDSQATPDNPRGYDENNPPEELYADVEGETISILDWVETHFRAAERLFQATRSFVYDEMGDELDEYHRLSSYRPDDIESLK